MNMLPVVVEYVARSGRCNAVFPGTVKSPSLQERLRVTGDYEQSMRDFTARQPKRRSGRPEEIAALAAYLASDEAGFTTEQTHIVDGGWPN